MTVWAELAPTLWGVAALAAIAVAVLAAYRVAHTWEPPLAIGRGALQLAVISVILTGIISDPAWIALALVTMFTIATAVATRRLGGSWRTGGLVAAAMAAGIVTSTAVVFGTRALELTPRYALAIGAIIIGNAMTVATLTGRDLVTVINDHWDEVEGWLALGATPRQSTITLARRAIREALIPSIDQTKTTGLVVLPGAFVGAIFGGVSPLEAGRFQIVVLAAILAAGAITAVLIAHFTADVRTRPVRL